MFLPAFLAFFGTELLFMTKSIIITRVCDYEVRGNSYEYYI